MLFKDSGNVPIILYRLRLLIMGRQLKNLFFNEILSLLSSSFLKPSP